MKRFSIFKRKPESPAEQQALANLDEETRDVAWSEFDKEVEREQGGGSFGPLTFAFPRKAPVPFHHVPGDPVPEPVDDPDPADSRSLRDVLHEKDEQGTPGK
jgi:hypothetical protein